MTIREALENALYALKAHTDEPPDCTVEDLELAISRLSSRAATLLDTKL